MAWRFRGRARVSATNPQAFGVCDRCGNWYNLVDLGWQYDYRGPLLQNLRIRVCDRCMDIPQNQLRPVITSPDPLPVVDPRPELFDIDEGDWYIICNEYNQYLVTETNQILVTTKQMVPDPNTGTI